MNPGDRGAERPARGTGLERIRLEVSGAVQGVGFRPFVYRLAEAERLSGFVANTAEGATIEVEGPPPRWPASSRAWKATSSRRPPSTACGRGRSSRRAMRILSCR